MWLPRRAAGPRLPHPPRTPGSSPHPGRPPTARVRNRRQCGGTAGPAPSSGASRGPGALPEASRRRRRGRGRLPREPLPTRQPRAPAARTPAHRSPWSSRLRSCLPAEDTAQPPEQGSRWPPSALCPCLLRPGVALCTGPCAGLHRGRSQSWILGTPGRGFGGRAWAAGVGSAAPADPLVWQSGLCVPLPLPWVTRAAPSR